MDVNVSVGSVIHWDVPDNMDAYVQEIGRAGRAGERAECIMLVKDNWYEQACIRFKRSPHQLETNVKLAQVVRKYCWTDACRRGFILRYFSAIDEVQNCGSSCDVCMLAK
jgi:ATP-dependent DNA helicase RecQ